MNSPQALSPYQYHLEQVEAFNGVVFDNGQKNTVKRADVFSLQPKGVDLVYLDPPYVPRADDNCYMKRYHFLEGLSCYWKGVLIIEGNHGEETKVKKIEKPHTPFSYRRSAIQAFDRLFQSYRDSIMCSRTVPTVSPTGRFWRICCGATRGP